MKYYRQLGIQWRHKSRKMQIKGMVDSFPIFNPTIEYNREVWLITILYSSHV